MLVFVKNTEGGLQIVPDLTENCWLRVIDPAPDEMQRVCECLGVPHDYLASSLDPHEHSHLERDGDRMLMVLRIPHFQGQEADIPYTTVPFGVILTPSHIATVCKIDSPVVPALISERKKGLTPAKKYRFILFVLLNIAKDYLKSVEFINAQVDIL